MSGPITILTPPRNGKVVIEYQSNKRRDITDTLELHDDTDGREIQTVLMKNNDNWDYANWLDPDKWHNGTLEGTDGETVHT